jgi:hypothetical protein
MTKRQKVTPACLNTVQKMELRANILREYPNIGKFASEIDFLIEQYSLDKDYVQKLMKTACASEALLSQAQGGVSTLEVGTPEYQRVMDAMGEASQKLAGKSNDDNGACSSSGSQ